MTSARDSASRLRQTLNPLLTTSLGGFHGQLNTPHSAVSVSSPYTYSAAQTPSSSIQPYNPQEWGPSPAVERPPHQFPPPQSSHDAPVSPPPPPPYSPPRSQRPVSQLLETPPANTSAARIPPTVLHRPSPEPAGQQCFPPPPNTGGRGASRERRFGLPSLSRRRDTTGSTTPPDLQPAPAPAPRPQTLMIQVPQPRTDHIAGQPVAPPAARRAASASAIETPTSARSRSASQSRWEPGMPLPPPPPGPPPPGSRSQSLNRTSDPVASPPTRRPPPGGVAALGPVPPTPADWVEEERQRPNRPGQPNLSVDTASASSATNSGVPESSTSGSSSAGAQLARAGAVRGEKSLRERRNESRTRHSRGDSSSDIPPLSDIVVPQGGGGLTRRFSVHRGTPRSGGRLSQEAPWSGQSDATADSRNSTPRVAADVHPDTPTPPFSPQPRKAYVAGDNGQPLAPKALPTPPPQSRSASSSSVSRPEMSGSIGSLIQCPLPSTPMTKQTGVSQSAELFCQRTVERFQNFARKEAAAASDADRVKLFADFIVSESRIRRERYNAAIGAMGSEIFDLTRDLFRPIKPRRESGASEASDGTPLVSGNRSHRGSFGSNIGREPAQQSSSAPSSAGLPVSPAGGPPNNVNWNSNYMPSLSPILSMSVSEGPDESSSRGRPASRWWEESDSVGESSQHLERSKRESKYMGVPKEAREALQWYDAPNSGEDSMGRHYGPDEYPPEKVGLHEGEGANTPHALRRSLLGPSTSLPNTPSPSHLDVSRLVTLPPPYPRHHPAVNNNHPELSEMRALVRTLCDMKELQQTKENYARESQEMRDEAASSASQRRQTLRINLQREIGSGNMSYADAAAIEADSAEAERSQAKELGKKVFDKFQNGVVMPLNEILMGRIGQATSLFDELRSRLFVETHTSDPNMPQEEGDEQPELLEKLTLLKWIFEAREVLHREIFDILSDRNDRYKEMVITPYRLSGNDEKLRGAEAFFAEDAEKRRVSFAHEVLKRTREFRGVVQQNVERGIDMQLNAFWDIAPPLKSLLDKVPQGLENFRIQIPPAEFEENPSYHQHPLQYLYSLLLHAEKSTYQFIESQTNLFCLLHEVKEAVMGARAKLGEAEGRDGRSIEEGRKVEQEQLTDDLKEKVRVVRGQWDEGLGETIRGVKERVGEWLLSTGGWDETLEDVGVSA